MIFRDYVIGNIRRDRKSHLSSSITIFLAVLILSSFLFGVFSYYKSYRDIIGKTNGGYHFRIVDNITSEDGAKLLENRHIKKVGFMNVLVLDEAFGSKEKTKLFQMDENSLTTISSWLKEGKLPQVNQVMISNDMAMEINKSIGDRIDVNGSSHLISGTYFDSNYEFENYYSLILNVSQDELLSKGQDVSPFIWYKNIFKTYKISPEIMKNLKSDYLTYNYNSIFLDRSFVFYPEDDLLKDHTFQVIVIILFFILVLLFYSTISNLFLVQEAHSIKEYSKLKALGATNRDITKVIRLKAIYISQIPILLGIGSSIIMVKILFFTLSAVENYFAKSMGIMKSYVQVSLSLNFFLSVFIYILAFSLVYLSTKKPIKKINKNSILSGLKGQLKSKSYKKYDLKYRANIGNDLAKQFYKNSRRSFTFTNVTLKLGFSLMAFIMVIITYYGIEEKYNTIDKFTSYNIQGEFASLKALNESFVTSINNMGIEEFINFRKESVYLDYNEELIDESFIQSSSLASLEDYSLSLENIKINIIGLEDNKFQDLVLKNGFDPESFTGNKVLLLNTMGDNFNLPASKIKDVKFFKDHVNSIGVSEYGTVLRSPGYEFSLNIEDKIYKALFDYPLPKNRLNCYMAKSQYIDLLNRFEKIADLDQFEYLAIKTDRSEEVQSKLSKLSLNYFKEGDFTIDSKLNQDNLLKKRTLIANILTGFFSIFFIVVGFSNCYFSLYNLFSNRKNNLILYKAIGMDQKLLDKVLKIEKNKILFSFIASMPVLLIFLAFIVANSSKVFTTIDILKKVNYLFIILYILLIYVSISKMYTNAKNEII